MSVLSDQLAKLGIRPADGDTVPASVGDVIDEIMSLHFPWPSTGMPWHPALIAQARDVRETLERWVEQIDLRLDAHGTELTKTLQLPHTPSGSHYVMGGQRHEHLEQCKHRHVQVHESVAVLICKACKLPVNAVWWVATYTDAIKRSVSWATSMQKEKKELREEIEALKKERNKHRSAVQRKNKKDATK